MMMGVLMGTLWFPVFNIGFGVSAATLGLILMVQKMWDAIVDPFIGNLSDNTRTRWGRRRPWIVVFAITTAILIPLVWRMDPEWSEQAKVIWIAVVGTLLLTSGSLYSMPYFSFVLELTPNYDERTRIAAWRAFIAKVLGLATGWVMWMVMWSGKNLGGQETEAGQLVVGTQWVAFFLAGVVLVFGLLPGLFVKERYYEKGVSKGEKESFWKSLKETFSCGPLWLVIGMIFFNTLGGSSVVVLGQYINFYLVSEGRIADAAFIEGWKNTAMFTTGILAIPFWTWFCERFDKKTSMYVILSAAFIGHGLNYVCLNPAYPYLQLVPAVFYSAITSSIWLILPSMMADITDYDELKTGLRREGSLNAVFSWCLHTAFALAAGISGYLLTLTGCDPSLGSAQPAEVLVRMKITYVLAPFVLWGISLIFLMTYRLNRARMLEIRQTLEARRGKV